MNQRRETRLEDLGKIVLGATPRAYTRNVDESEANAVLLKGKEFTALGEFETSEMEAVQVDDAKDRLHRHFLRAGDVVLLARGSAIRAGYVSSEVASKNVMASANFIIIRPNQAKVLGEVIAAYINSPIGRQALLKHRVGTAVQHVPASALRRFSLPVPSEVKQRIIADLYSAGLDAYRETVTLAKQQLNVSNAAITTLLQGAVK